MGIYDNLDANEFMKMFANCWFIKIENMWRFTDKLRENDSFKFTYTKNQIPNGEIVDYIYGWIQSNFESILLKSLQEMLNERYGHIGVFKVSDLRDGKFEVDYTKLKGD